MTSGKDGRLRLGGLGGGGRRLRVSHGWAGQGSLSLDLVAERLFHPRQPGAGHDEGSVLALVCLAETREDDVDMGMGGVAVFGRDPAQLASPDI
jgi:hypothetical protein